MEQNSAEDMARHVFFVVIVGCVMFMLASYFYAF